MNNSEAPTHFLPAARASADAIEEQGQLLAGCDLHTLMLDAVSDGVVILNEERQIVYSNASFQKLSPLPASILGARVGEALNCVHAKETAGGCGTTQFCSTCGAAKAMWKGRKVENVRECQITRKRGHRVEALVLRVQARPLVAAGNRFILFTVRDISHEVRRRALERIFFHDIGNTIGQIRGLSQLITLDAGEEHAARFLQGLGLAVERLNDEISAQRTLLAAEEGTLEPQPCSFNVRTFTEELVSFYQDHPVANGRNLRLYPGNESTTTVGDYVLLGRVVGNMIKNGLEASEKGQTVTVGCHSRDSTIYFWVHNPTFMPQRIQLQLFRRSFSTKGVGRGLGTYSMKLLCEQYLNGRIAFRSSKDRGTLFAACLPHVSVDADA